MNNGRSSVVNPSDKLDLTGLRVGLLYWEKFNTVRSYQQLFEHMGFHVTSFSHNESLPDGLDVVFVRGPNGSLVPLEKQLHAYPAAKRPALIYLLTEPLPHPKIPQWLLYWAGRARSKTERISYRQDASGQWEMTSRLSANLLKAYRFSYYGDLLWMRARGILSVLAISSEWNARFLRTKGFDPLVLPLCYPREQNVNFKQERDIPVLWIGKAGTKRRERILKRVREDLSRRGVEMMVIDGVENPYVFGNKRDALLSRTKIVLNIIRQWWDDNSLRYLLSIPKGAMIVTEPTLPHTSFKSGLHLVEAPVSEIPERINYYLEHEDERLAMVERAYQELTRLSPVDVMRTAFEKAVKVSLARQFSPVAADKYNQPVNISEVEP